MLAAGKEGLVVAQAVIAAEGCVASVRVLRTAGASLDLAAIRAITGWRFAPLRVDAAPTDGLATLTVNFGTR